MSISASLPHDERETEWGEDGKVSVTLEADEVTIGRRTPSFITYRVSVMLTPPGKLEPQGWERTCRTPEEVETCLDTLQKTVAIMGGPMGIELPAIDPRTGRPAPLPRIG